jgi:DoxX-like family
VANSPVNGFKRLKPGVILKLNTSDKNLLRYSLVFVWLFTALVSLWELNGQSAQLLKDATLGESASRWLILSGAAIDIALGLLMWGKPSRRVYQFALLVMLFMTLLATVFIPALWLHPLGPLTKNVPMAVMLLILARSRS